MFTLDIKSFYKYIIVSVFLFIFNYIYSFFSHGISSAYMTYMFVIPLIFGLFNIVIKKNVIFNNLYLSSMITYIYYMLLKGIFEIAGTESNYLLIILYIGHILLLSSLISIFIKKVDKN